MCWFVCRRDRDEALALDFVEEDAGFGGEVACAFYVAALPCVVGLFYEVADALELIVMVVLHVEGK